MAPKAKKEENKRLVILDTHAILHRAYHALPDFASTKGEPTGALYGLVSMLVKIINDLKPDYIAAAYDLPGGTFRHAAYEDYKANRIKADDDLYTQINRARDVLKGFGIPIYEAKGFEADDVLGTIATQVKKKKGIDTIIASGDLDTVQLVDGTQTRVFTLRKGLTDTVFYDEDAVRARFGFGPESIPDLKGIAGDASDNIKGVPGVGEGSAIKLLQIYGSIEKIYAAIKKEGVEKIAENTGVQKRFVQLVADNKESAEFSKQLATIHCEAPVEFEVPKKSWQESVDQGKIMNMLVEFDFRSLMPRVKELLLQNSSAKNPYPQTDEDAGSARPRLDFVAEDSAAAQVPPEQLAKATLAVSVADSSVAEPDIEDVYRMGKSRDFDEAYKNLLETIKREGLEFIYNKVEMPLMPVLRRMEARGICVDAEFLKKLSKEYTAELEKIAKRIYAHAGGEFNIGSPKQLGEVLFDKLGLQTKKKTAGGQRSTRESELQKLADAHPIIGDILMYRELSKLLSTYIDAIPTQLDKEGRLHTRYVQIGAATGRMASKDPNLQNIPIKSDLGRRIRHAFVASKGMKLVSFDYSQIELRIAAILSGDEGLVEIFKSGRDVHTEVATRVFGAQSSLDPYEQRRRAKVINFGLLYGMGVNALQQGLGTSRKEAQEFYNQYLETFPRLASYLEEVKGQAAKQGYTETLFGRKRYHDGIRSPIPYVKAAAERMAINAPMQGTSADITKLAMIEVDKLFATSDVAHQLLQVHDELVFEIEEEHIKELAPKIKKAMEGVVPAEKAKGVPIVVDGKFGPNWGEMKKIDA
ncbi:MAG TPA: DNA polymerase [Candidatus Paceibacterota bacterium]|nr:DNA polymerase [Candidatus Paceibacterota bacterium]